jgi:hypothetical protein
MRIRITIDLDRKPTTAQVQCDHAEREYVPSAQVEHAGPQPLGFQIAPPRTEDA